jgi:hypothetical protein
MPFPQQLNHSGSINHFLMFSLVASSKPTENCRSVPLDSMNTHCVQDTDWNLKVADCTFEEGEKLIKLYPGASMAVQAGRLTVC